MFFDKYRPISEEILYALLLLIVQNFNQLGQSGTAAQALRFEFANKDEINGHNYPFYEN